LTDKFLGRKVKFVSNITPDPNKRSYLLPPGCKDLIDVLQPSKPVPKIIRVNGKIRAHEVRVIGEKGQSLGVMLLVDALKLAKAGGVDLVEIARHAKPPVCRLVDFGKFYYELSKKGN
jgi:hypothetical protein